MLLLVMFLVWANMLPFWLVVVLLMGLQLLVAWLLLLLLVAWLLLLLLLL
jgi:hypothetical protein